MIQHVILVFLLGLGLDVAALGQTVIFENVNVIPMDRERVLERQTVIVRDGRIAELGPARKVRVPDGALRVGGTGKYLMPGLAEMHGHLPPPNTPREAVETSGRLRSRRGLPIRTRRQEPG